MNSLKNMKQQRGKKTTSRDEDDSSFGKMPQSNDADGHIDQMKNSLRRSFSKRTQKKHESKNVKRGKPTKTNEVSSKKKGGKGAAAPKSVLKKNEPKKRKNEEKPVKQAEPVHKKRKQVEEMEDLLYEDDLLEEEEDDDYSDDGKRTFGANSDESDIEDDLNEEDIKRNKSDSVIITKDMLDDIAKEDEDPDDKIIAYLERKLKIKKNKKNMDDLDFDPSKPSDLEQFVKDKRMQKKQKAAQKEEEESDGEEILPGYEEPEVGEEDMDAMEGFESMFGDLDGEDFVNLDAEIDAMIEAEQKGKTYSDFLSTEIPTLSSMKKSLTSKQSASEDTTEEEEPTNGKYVPPHLRKKQLLESGQKSESYLALQKSLRNLLNKISLANLGLVTKEALQLYEQSSKNEFTEILANCIIESVCDSVDLKSQFILVYAAFIVAIHNIGGTNIGANFMEKLVLKFEAIKNERHQASNLLTLICHVYNLGLIYCGLIYDIIRMLCVELNELNVEFLFKLLQACGFQLKLDDPAAMKDIIDVIKTTFEKYEEEMQDEGSTVAKRMKFLVEMIYDLRNNRKRQYQEDISEQYKQLKQVVKDMQKKEKKTGENTLRIPYNDFINAETKGRWWLVGSAWQGNQHGAESEDTSHMTSLSSLKNKDNISTALNDMDPELIKKLEKMAKDQRMTTDLRKAIFYVIMGSDDFLDAFQRLVGLGIKKNNREIARVLLHCCSQEKSYNQYYSKLAEKLCSVEQTNRAFQYTFYEHFDELSKYSVRKLINLSKLLADLVGKGSLSLAMLKVVDFNALVQLEVIFFRLLILNLILDFTEVETTRCFLRLAKLEEHDELKESLVLFLYQFVKKEFRRGFIYELLTLKDITKKDDKKWMKEQEKIVKSRASTLRKVLRTNLEEVFD